MAGRDMRSTWAKKEAGVLVASGVCSTGPSEPWALGRWRLDDLLLEFAAPGKTRSLRVPLKNIRRLETTRRKFLVVAKPVLVVTYLPRAASSLRRLWLLTGDLPSWESGLAVKASALRSSPELGHIRKAVALTRALEVVAGPTAQILDLLTSGSPVTSATLAALLKLDEHNSVTLSSVVSVGFAGLDQVLGAPALRYERHRFEPSTATVHSMRWWLDDLVAGSWLALRAPLEVHRDGDNVVAITSVPTRSSQTPPSLLVEADGRGLVLSGARDYMRYIKLPVAVCDDVAMTMHSNGTLVIVGRCRPAEQTVMPRLENSSLAGRHG